MPSRLIDGADAPASSSKAVTPHASNDLPDGVCRSLWVGGAGDVAVIADRDSVAVVFKGCAAGSIIPVYAKAVRVTGTTATDIVALY